MKTHDAHDVASETKDVAQGEKPQGSTKKGGGKAGMFPHQHIYL
jgi:hypothetical protein